MKETTSGDEQMVRNLASALHEHREQTRPKPGTQVTDHHILKAMLGKRWGEAQSPPAPIRKAG